jgi:hypothetical protein
MKKALPRPTVTVKPSMQRKAFQVGRALPPRILEFNCTFAFLYEHTICNSHILMYISLDLL